jgi:hypothetical protein
MRDSSQDAKAPTVIGQKPAPVSQSGVWSLAATQSGKWDVGQCGPWTVSISNSCIMVKGPLTDAELRAQPIPVSVVNFPESGSAPGGGLTNAELRADAVHVSASSLPLPAGAATDAGLVAIASVLMAPPTQPISGSVSVSNFPASQAVTGPITDAQLRATAVPVSATALPLPAGAATSAKQDLQTADLDAIKAAVQGTLAVGGTFWQATQPVSGTFWQATQPVSAVSLPLPSGAATSAKQDSLITAAISPASKRIPTNSTLRFPPLPRRRGRTQVTPRSPASSPIWRFCFRRKAERQPALRGR